MSVYQPGYLGLNLPNEFDISPAVEGKTTWNLADDGPLVLSTDGSWTITPSRGFRASVELYGAGAGGGSFLQNGGHGGDSTFDTMTAGGGRRGISQDNGAAGGDGGVATGGDTNENGQDGEDPTAFDGGAGGDAGGPDGGEGGAGSGGDGGFAGLPGTEPGGGGGGNASDGGGTASGGGGGGAYTKKTYNRLDLTPDAPLTLVVGNRGTGGGGTGADGGNGADGGAIITAA